MAIPMDPVPCPWIFIIGLEFNYAIIYIMRRSQIFLATWGGSGCKTRDKTFLIGLITQAIVALARILYSYCLSGKPSGPGGRKVLQAQGSVTLRIQYGGCMFVV